MKDPYKVARSLQRRGLACNNADGLDEDGHQYNCWGLTAWLAGWMPKPDWMEQKEITELLEKKTVPVEKPKAGDIVVFGFRKSFIEHTAMIHQISVSKGPVVIQKRGFCELCVASVDEVIERDKRIYGRVQEYRRIT